MEHKDKFKIVSHIVDGGSVRVTPTNLDGGTYVTLDAVGDTVVFFLMIVHGKSSVDMDMQ